MVITNFNHTGFIGFRDANASKNQKKEQFRTMSALSSI